MGPYSLSRVGEWTVNISDGPRCWVYPEMTAGVTTVGSTQNGLAHALGIAGDYLVG